MKPYSLTRRLVVTVLLVELLLAAAATGLALLYERTAEPAFVRFDAARAC